MVNMFLKEPSFEGPVLDGVSEQQSRWVASPQRGAVGCQRLILVGPATSAWDANVCNDRSVDGDRQKDVELPGKDEMKSIGAIVCEEADEQVVVDDRPVGHHDRR